MLILLPPSESKPRPPRAPPGPGRPPPARAGAPAPPVAGAALAEVSGERNSAAGAGRRPVAGRRRRRNRQLRTEPSAPALEKYTRCCSTHWTPRASGPGPGEVADSSLLVVSALWGAVRPHRPDSGLPAVHGNRAAGRGKLGGWLEAAPRTGARQLAADQWWWTAALPPMQPRGSPAPAPSRCRWGGAKADSTRSVVSHHAKHTRGLVARALCEVRSAGGALDTVHQVRTHWPSAGAWS
ncbi:peroxide stress protein YaaA [Kocuria rhizophila]|nr:peroxide stress protein YaaA [Kocuria rhizophila]